MSFDNRSSAVEGNGSNPEMQSQAPTLCKAGCGFYGNPVQDGLCSKCYKDKAKRLQPSLPSISNSTARAPSPIAQSDARSLFSPSSSSSLSSTSSNHESSSKASEDTESPQDEATEGVLRAPETAEEQASQDSLTTATSNVEISSSDGDTESTAFTEQEASTGKQRKNRCLACNKKVGLTGFGCRCGGLFCSTHRYSDMHSCDFDYKEHAQDQIRKNNPVVVGKKITKI